MRRILVALLLVGASASECPIESEIPLEQPSPKLLDSQLVGSWSCRQDGGSEVHVRPIGDRELEISIGAGQGEAGPSTLRGYTTKVESVNFLVVQFVQPIVSGTQPPQPQVRGSRRQPHQPLPQPLPVESDGYFIMPYEFESPSSLCLGVVWFELWGRPSAPRPSTPSSLRAFVRGQLSSGTLSPKTAKGGVPPDGCAFLACDRAKP